MTPDEINQSMCRSSMWRGFAEKIEAKPKRPDRLVHCLRRWSKMRDKDKSKAKSYMDRLYNRYCRFLLFRLCKYGTGEARK